MEVISFIGASRIASFSHGIIEREIKAIRIPKTPTTTVAIMSALGIVLVGSFASSDRYVVASQPKNVSTIKKRVTKTKGNGWVNKGARFPKSARKNPGIITARSTIIVIVVKKMAARLLASIPMYAITLSNTMKTRLMIIL